MLAAIRECWGDDMRRIVWVVVITVGVLLLAAVFTAIAWPARWRTIRSSVYDYRWWLVLAAVVAVAILVLLLLNKLLGHRGVPPWRGTSSPPRIPSTTSWTRCRPRPSRPSRLQAVGRRSGGAPSGRSPQGRLAPGRQTTLGRRAVPDWWTGAPCEAAYVNLHEAEIALAQSSPRTRSRRGIPEALARLQTMDVTDPRRRAAETQLTSNSSASDSGPRSRAPTRIGLELKDQQHDRLRGFRNIVLATTAG